jgi:DNA-binding PadR family transcriptional regulator
MFQHFLLGFIKIHILHHAAEAPLYGLSLIEELRRHGYRLSPGTVYPVLHGLAEAGYLKRESQIVRGKVRKYYTITATGRRALGAAGSSSSSCGRSSSTARAHRAAPAGWRRRP